MYSTMEIVISNYRVSILWMKITSIGFVTEAMDKYTEALAASDFSKETGNVDTLVLPILCNLAACCIQIGNLSAVRISSKVNHILLQIWLR